MRLYLVRHGIAEDYAESDFARELTPRGRRRVEASARVMRRLKLKPARIYSSPRLRARQTAEIIGDALGLPVQLAEQVNFGFDRGDITSLTRDLAVDDEVMFVGHNPDMSLLAHELTGVDVGMKKGGLARIDLLGKRARSGELVWLIAPKVFDALDSAKPEEAIQAQSWQTPPQKLPATDARLHDLIKHRWSPVGFDSSRLIEPAKLLSILEAGRWSASSYNLQPWRFIVAPRENEAEFKRVLSVLAAGNQSWARNAAVLMIGCAGKYGRPGEENRHARHDLGQAIAQMVLQALDLGIYTHQMGGFYPDKARALYGVPQDFDPFTAIAMGYRAPDPAQLSEQLQMREAGQRVRHSLDEIIFSGAWAEPADFLP